MFNEIKRGTDVITTPNTLETKVFLNTMAKTGRQFKHYSNKLYYKLSIFECEWVWLRSQNKRKLRALYHGPYNVHSCLKQSMIIQKNSGLVKVFIRNVKTYVPRVATCTETGSYKLRERKFPISYAEVSSSESELRMKHKCLCVVSNF